ncbi:MAG: hypothetical protein ACE5II_02390 [Anaerolineae bacterium]
MELDLLQSTSTIAYWPEPPSPQRAVEGRAVIIPPAPEVTGEASAFEAAWNVSTRRFRIDEPIVHVYDQWIDAGVPVLTYPYVPRIQPEVIIKPSARPMFTDRVRATLNRLVVLLEREARQNFVPVDKIEMDGFVDPEEDTEEVVVTQWVRISAEAALDYWDRLGATLEAWIDLLPEELGRIAAERIAVEVRWDVREPQISASSIEPSNDVR